MTVETNSLKDRIEFARGFASASEGRRYGWPVRYLHGDSMPVACVVDHRDKTQEPKDLEFSSVRAFAAFVKRGRCQVYLNPENRGKLYVAVKGSLATAFASDVEVDEWRGRGGNPAVFSSDMREAYLDAAEAGLYLLGYNSEQVDSIVGDGIRESVPHFRLAEVHSKCRDDYALVESAGSME
ncbi:MAG: hypothetical protein HYW25_01320 [Candidatus Aenigmarchaeota archaeon]|nr:hypothetical protein [Candidatus Aenigmarchaeota archaeon]